MFVSNNEVKISANNRAANNRGPTHTVLKFRSFGTKRAPGLTGTLCEALSIRESAPNSNQALTSSKKIIDVIIMDNFCTNGHIFNAALATVLPLLYVDFWSKIFPPVFKHIFNFQK